MRITKILFVAAAIGCMMLVIGLSHQPATLSNDLSSGVTDIVIAAVEKIYPNAAIDYDHFNHVVRKNAHFFIYLLLGIIVSAALIRLGVPGYRNLELALLICVLFAITDEVHQLYVPGRGAQASDVLIDSAGACLGIGIYALYRRYLRRGTRK